MKTGLLAALLTVTGAIEVSATDGPATRPPPPDTAETFTYSKHISRIFQKRCQDCHRPGEVAPMALLSYEDARPWARSIKKYVLSGEMPPWHADPKYGRFKNDARLPQEEIDAIVAWVDAGAPEGNPEELPPPKTFSEGWRIGEPDAVFALPVRFKVKPEGEVEYQYFSVQTDFEEDKWIQAAEARPGNREVVHHIIVFIKEPGKRGSLFGNHLCGTAPGMPPDIFPEGTAKLVKAGSTLIFQMHYTPTGEVEYDRSSVGLRFAKEPPKQRMRLRAIMNRRFRIPPGDPAFATHASYTFRRPGTIWSFTPHMHLRGKSFRYELHVPGREPETLLWIPEYDFDWQNIYRLETPRRVPAGARIECTGIFDNSKDNPDNPDPEATVRWGDQTWEEMMIGFVEITFASENLVANAPKAPPPPQAAEGF